MENNVELIFRKAKEADIPSIVKMLADDELGSKREAVSYTHLRAHET